MIEIIPAIDIMSAGCVRLTNGDFGNRTSYDVTPVDMARRYEQCGVRRIHMVDLEGAKASSPRNLSTLEKVASAVKCSIEWGGGIACDADLESVFSAGADYAVIGSIAVLEPQVFERWLSMYGNRMILGADIRNGLVAVKGWMQDSDLTLSGLMDRFGGSALDNVICTDISRDGMLQGPSFDLYSTMQRNYPGVDITVSGGISTMNDIVRLDGLGLRKVIVGKAIYEKRITLKEIEEWLQNE